MATTHVGPVRSPYRGNNSAVHAVELLEVADTNDDVSAALGAQVEVLCKMKSTTGLDSADAARLRQMALDLGTLKRSIDHANATVRASAPKHFEGNGDTALWVHGRNKSLGNVAQ